MRNYWIKEQLGVLTRRMKVSYPGFTIVGPVVCEERTEEGIYYTIWIWDQYSYRVRARECVLV